MSNLEDYLDKNVLKFNLEEERPQTNNKKVY